MSFKKGDIVLIKFPFTSLRKAKKRPVLILKNENEYGDFICFQITSNKKQSNIHIINKDDLFNGSLPLVSYIKYDKCFTLNAELVDKKLASVNDILLEQIKIMFCNAI